MAGVAATRIRTRSRSARRKSSPRRGTRSKGRARAARTRRTRRSWPSVQSKLRDQATSLAERMKARQLEGAGDSFKSFVDGHGDRRWRRWRPASEKLKIAKWQDALPPEQKALQYLLRAEATFRDIQVAFGTARRRWWRRWRRRYAATCRACSISSSTPKRTSTRARRRAAAGRRSAAEADRRSAGEAEAARQAPAGAGRAAAPESTADAAAAVAAGNAAPPGRGVAEADCSSRCRTAN